MDGKTYPPQPWIHEADCTDAPRGLVAFRAHAANDLYPYGRPHTCFNRATVEMNRTCVAEPPGDEPHPYLRSTIWPEDAIGPLCSTCRGTHPESAIVALTRRRATEPA